MIANDCELQVGMERIRRFQDQVTHLSQTEPGPENYRAASGGFLAEIDRMQLEVREFLTHHPAKPAITD
jgi:hypothetical protein